MKQITLLLKNRTGVLAEVTELLAARGINIENLSAEGASEMGVMVMQVDRYDEALALLNENGYNAVTEDALVVRLPNQPGALAGVARRFRDAGIDIRSITVVDHDEKIALAAISTDRTQEALDLVRDILVE